MDVLVRFPRDVSSSVPPRLSHRLLVTGLLMLCSAHEARADLGKWSPAVYWGTVNSDPYAVHMILLPGDNAPYHSRILWWKSEEANPAVFNGGQWGWRTGNDGCDNYPTATFDPLGMPTSGLNVFCAGNAQMADGRVFVPGGTDPVIGEYGVKDVRIFTPGSGTNQGTWANPGTMTQERWYPTATTLKDGRVMVTSGDQFHQHQIYGGRKTGAAPSGDMVQRFSPVNGGRWEASVEPDADPVTGSRPEAREGHTALDMSKVTGFQGSQVIFGGKGASGALNDVWFLRRDANITGSDYHYAWLKQNPGGGTQPVRSEHTAVVALDGMMVVYGGVDASGQPLSDVRRLYWDAGTQTFNWHQISTAGPNGAPSARRGHTAIYDDGTYNGVKRMIVFGGADGSQTPSDNQVWELRFDSAQPDNATWYPMQDANPQGPHPAARFGHAMVYYANLRSKAGKLARAVFVHGGQLGANSYSGELWVLWLYADGAMEWELKAPSGNAPTARARHSMILDPLQGYEHAPLARLHIFGGESAAGPVDSLVYKVDPWNPSAAWIQWAAPGFSLSRHTAVLNLDENQARFPEVFDPSKPAGQQWQVWSASPFLEPTYQVNFVVPRATGGRVVAVGPFIYPHYLDIPDTGQPGNWQRIGQAPGYCGTDFFPHSAVMYRPGLIMIAGGADGTGSTVGKTRTLDAHSMTNCWDSTWGDMLARQNHNLVILPTGKVLAVGGEIGSEGSPNPTPVQRPQLWDPDATNHQAAWSPTTSPNGLAVQPLRRGYHSTAILLPDGRVLSSGGEYTTANDKWQAEIFCPPYLFKSDGTTPVTIRPSIAGAPAQLTWGETFTVCTSSPTQITRACLIRPGATTHAFDENQRYVPLSKTAETSTPPRLFLTSPAGPDEAPPGDYMLFLTGSSDGDDVPSVARWVHLGNPAGLDACDVVVPATTTNLSATLDPNTCDWILNWTAPADDGTLAASGRVTQYDIRTYSFPIDDSNWNQASPIGGPTPSAPGSTETWSVSVIGTTYARMKSRDDNNGWSGQSNQVILHVGQCGGGGMWAGGGGGGGNSIFEPAAATLSSEEVAATISDGENTVLSGSTLGTFASDRFALRAPNLETPAGITIRLRAAPGRATSLDRGRLMTVDHSPSVRTFLVGDPPLLGEALPLLAARDAAGSDVTASFNGSKAPFSGDSGAVVTVDLPPSGGAATPVLIDASGLGPSDRGILVQTPDGAGGWQTLSTARPRWFFDETTVGGVAANQVRLVFLSSHQVRFVGRVIASTERPVVQWAGLSSARSAKLGDVASALSAVDGAQAALAGPDTLQLIFSAPPLGVGLVREYVLAVDGTQFPPQKAPAAQALGSGPSEAAPRFTLGQSQPNPFENFTSIGFELPVGAMVRLEVFDAQGRRVALLANRYYPAGDHRIEWDGRGLGGASVEPGVYFYRMQAGPRRAEKKMVVLRQ